MFEYQVTASAPMAEAPPSRLSVDDRHPQSFDDDRHRQSFSERNLHLQYELNEDDRHLRHPRHRRLPRHLRLLMSQRRDPVNNPSII